MPTVKLDINTGLEYSPTDGVDSLVKLHNFTVGTDGSLYKLPALKNLETLPHQYYRVEESENKFLHLPVPIQDIKKTDSFVLPVYKSVEGFTPYFPVANPDGQRPFLVYSYRVFRRYFYSCSLPGYGLINIDYENNLVTNEEIRDLVGSDRANKFVNDSTVPSGLDPLDPHNDPGSPYYQGFMQSDTEIALAPLKNEGDTMAAVILRNQIFNDPSFYLYISGYSVPNVIGRGLSFSEGIISLKGQSFSLTNGTYVGPVALGSRCFIYEKNANCIYISEPNDFTSLMPNPDASTEPYKIIPTEPIQGMTEFNGDLLVFTPTGIDRWVWNANAGSDDKRIILRDPSFKYSYRCRLAGSWVKANKDLYFFTDTFEVYVLKSNLTVETVFAGQLPSYFPISSDLDKPDGLDNIFKMAHFKLLGYRFVSIGPWLYNMDTKTWSTYTYDGWQKPTEDYDPATQGYLWESDLSKRLIRKGVDDVVCTYSTITTPLTYKEMDDYFDANPDAENTLIAGQTQWGKMALFCTRMYQQENNFSLDGILVYVRGGSLDKGEKLYLRILRGEDDGNADMDEDDPSTWGVPASYEPLQSFEGNRDTSHTGQFQWRMNIKCERFRVQIATNSKKGMVVQSVLANLTLNGETMGAGNQEQQNNGKTR